MSEWRVRTLSELTRKIGSGATPRGGSQVYTADGVALIRSQNVLDNSMRLEGIARITDAAATALNGVTVENQDVLINITGDSIARCAVVDPSILPARVNQHVAILRTTKELHPGYLQRFLVNPIVKSALIGGGSGGTRNALTKASLGAIQVHFPSFGSQVAIAEVLGALDDKIAANHKLVSLATDLAQLTFRNAVTGAESVPLSDTAHFVNGKAFTKGASGSGRVVIRIAELNSGIGGSTVFSDAVVPQQHTAEPGDILFAWSGSLTLHRWYRPAAIINQHIFKVMAKEGIPNWLAFQLISAKLADFKATAADKATTMGHIQRHHLDEPVPVPDRSVVARINGVMVGLWNTALTAEQENVSLSTLRDTLLPQLMSGKLCVRDAERTLSEVL